MKVVLGICAAAGIVRISAATNVVRVSRSAAKPLISIASKLMFSNAAAPIV